MDRISFAAVVAALCISGCASAPMLPDTSAKDLAEAQCKTRFLTKDMKPPISPLVDCMTQADVAYRQQRGQVEYSQALALRAKQLALAEQYDAGQISLARWRAEVDLAMNDANNAVTSANAADAALRQQRSAAAIATGAALLSPPPSVTCNRMMNTVTCN